MNTRRNDRTEPTAALRGADFVALVELTNKAGDVLAAVGETCERVLPSSLTWLFADGLIAARPVSDDAPEGR